jgi:AraC-like DNA-binding protein
MTLLDNVLRFAGVGILLLAVAVLLRDAPRAVAARLVAAFSACVAAYLVLSAPGTSEGAFAAPLRVLAVAGPALAWLATLALFRDGFRPGALHFVPLVVLELTAWLPGAGLLHRAIVLALYAAAVGVAWKGHGADLVEARRRFRVGFVACTTAIGAGIIVGELTLDPAAVPAWLELLKVAAIAIASAVLLLWAIDLRPAWFTVPVPEPRRLDADDGLTPAERQLLAELRTAMETQRAYRREGLTIVALARELRVPEHALRRLINQRLGHRNFNAFLNRYRIEEVRAALRDPAKARLPILTLALEAGFSSIGPFNRAFKEACGVTPTEYRSAPVPAEPSPIPESAMDRRT